MFLKAENLQRVGAFKFRGAYNAVASLTDEPSARAASRPSPPATTRRRSRSPRGCTSVRAVILMPDDAPPGKLAATRGYGAEVIRFDRYGQDREELLAALVAERGLVPIHPYDDERVMAGQGTVALELIEDAGPLDAAARVRRRRRPDRRLRDGGQGAARRTCASSASSRRRATTCGRSLAAGERVRIAVPRTIADGQQLPEPGELTFPVIQRARRRGRTVSDAEIVDAMRFLFERVKTVTEPSGACAFAALLAGRVGDARACASASTISGGNVTATRFAELVG